MTRSEETAIISLCGFIVLAGPCGYGIYYASTKLNKYDSTGWLLLIVFLACVLTTLLCMFLSNCGNLAKDCIKDSCNCKCERKKKENTQAVPKPLVTPVSTTEISVEIVKV
jgi:hypothetical protein